MTDTFEKLLAELELRVRAHEHCEPCEQDSELVDEARAAVVAEVDRLVAEARMEGVADGPVYSVWAGMIRRCTKPDDAGYVNYGGRGITVCERWMDFHNFRSDMGPRPKGTSLDRENNDGPYSPDNCRWATTTQQIRNRRSTVFLEVDGVRKPVAQWAEETGLKYALIISRMRQGRSPEDILKLPSKREYPTRRKVRNNPRGVRPKMGRDSAGPPTQYYEAKIHHQKKRIYLGRYRTADEAAHAVNKAAVAIHGELAVLNPVGTDPRSA